MRAYLLFLLQREKVPEEWMRGSAQQDHFFSRTHHAPHEKVATHSCSGERRPHLASDPHLTGALIWPVAIFSQREKNLRANWPFLLQREKNLRANWLFLLQREKVPEGRMRGSHNRTTSFHELRAVSS